MICRQLGRTGLVVSQLGFGAMRLPRQTADERIECGDCEEKCPQHIQIREQLKAAHAALTAK